MRPTEFLLFLHHDRRPPDTYEVLESGCADPALGRPVKGGQKVRGRGALARPISCGHELGRDLAADYFLHRYGSFEISSREISSLS